MRIGDVEFRVTMRVDRCAVTLCDPDTVAKAKEPIRTLARRRAWAGKTWFGIRLVPLTPGRIEAGATVSPARSLGAVFFLARGERAREIAVSGGAGDHGDVGSVLRELWPVS